MSSLEELYQETILHHYKSPRNYRVMEQANRKAEGYNPLCGDKVSVYLDVSDGIIQDIAFQGTGCAISTASASLMTEALKGRSVEEAREVFETLHKVLTSADEGESMEDLGKLMVFQGVRKYPVRVKCATLAWHTLKAALANTGEQARTE